MHRINVGVLSRLMHRFVNGTPEANDKFLIKINGSVTPVVSNIMLKLRKLLSEPIFSGNGSIVDMRNATSRILLKVPAS